MSNTARIINEAIAELDEVRVGKIVRAVFSSIAEQVSHQKLAVLAERITVSLLEDWNPPGPELSDNAVRRMVRRQVSHLVYDTVLDYLKEIKDA